jgi:ribonuclease HI
VKPATLRVLIDWLAGGGGPELAARERRALLAWLEARHGELAAAGKGEHAAAGKGKRGVAGKGEHAAAGKGERGAAGDSLPPEALAPLSLSPGAVARLQCDGASRGNPGPAALGLVVSLDGQEIYRHGRALGTLTNNQAEYRSLLVGLEAVRRLGFRRIVVAMDSELVIRQLEGRYKVKNAGLMPLHAAAKTALAGFDDARLRHVPRGENAAADALANEALDSL